MKRRIAPLAVIVAAFIADQVRSQPPPPLSDTARRPVYSPYLNLTRQGGSPAQNYYGLVRPELEFRNNFTQLRRDTQALASDLASPTPGSELATGHATGYMTHLRFFGTNGAGRAPAQPAANIPPRPAGMGTGAPPPARRGRY